MVMLNYYGLKEPLVSRQCFYKGTTYQGFFGQANSANDNIYLAALNGKYYFTLQQGENVGIGTQSPKTKLR